MSRCRLFLEETGVTTWFQECIDLLYPGDDIPKDLNRLEAPFCKVCGRPYEGEITDEFKCMNCEGREWALDCARAAYLSEGYVREAIHEFKYRRRFHHLPKLSDWAFDGYLDYYSRQDITAIVPVPLHFWRKWRRGFNQAEQISIQLSKRIGIPMWDCLKRIKNTTTQTRLEREDRIKNQKGAFAMKRGFDVGDATLLVIDDVLTTGATTDACARVLKKAGARSVFVLTVARG